MQIEITNITPEMAVTWLEHDNNNNRRLRNWWVDALAYEIRNDNYILTHQGIAFDTDGRLIDGQHRLTAIVKSNKAIDMVVFRNVDKRAFGVLDKGIKRTMADLTNMNQKPVEVCKLLAGIYENRNLAQSTQLVVDIANAGILELHDELMTYSSSNRKAVTSAVVRAGAIISVLNGNDKDYVFTCYKNMANLDFDVMPSICQSFVKQSIGGTVIANKDRKLVIAKAFKMFDKNYANNSVLRITEADGDAAYQLIKTTISNLLGQGE